MIVLCTNKITIIYLMIVHKIPCVCVNYCSTYCKLFALGEGPIIYPMIVHKLVVRLSLAPNPTVTAGSSPRTNPGKLPITTGTIQGKVLDLDRRDF
jgi:hypothetical protein